MTVENFIRSNIEITSEPVRGSTFIMLDGKFVDLYGSAYDHQSFIKEVVDRNILNRRALDSDEIPELANAGWIRCNEDAGMGYSYLELRDKEPTHDQYEAIEKWVDFVLSRKKSVTIIFMPEYTWDEQEYGQTVSGYDIVKAIKSAYHRGELIPASAFESLSANEMAFSKKDVISRITDLGSELCRNIAILLLYRKFNIIHGRAFIHWIGECVNKYCLKLGVIKLKPDSKKLSEEGYYKYTFGGYGETEDDLYDLMDWADREYHLKGYQLVDMKVAMKNAFTDYQKLGRELCKMFADKKQYSSEEYYKVIRKILQLDSI